MTGIEQRRNGFVVVGENISVEAPGHQRFDESVQILIPTGGGG
jgi:hypothetical protein